MNNILVLVDLTDTAYVSVEQAIALGKADNALITLHHVSEGNHSESVADDLKPYADKVRAAGLKCEISIGYGEFYKEVEVTVKAVHPDLVVVGTHGKKGLKQNLFGANIYKLVQLLPAPSLVVNDNTEVSEGKFDRINLPVAPHLDYLVKVEQSCRVLSDDGTIVIFAINKPGMALSDEIVTNIQATKDYLDNRNVKWEYLEIDATLFSVGFSRETLKFMKEKKMDAISIMAKVSDQNSSFGKMDKENLLLNDFGLPVLCANQ